MINPKKIYLTIFLFLLCVTIIYLHYIHFSSFGFTDAYNSYARAYFLDKGRLLYSGIFSHHHMLMVYFSFVIQKLTNPESLYQLVLYHRIIIGICSVLFSLLIAWRFKWTGLIFVVVYELSKYYLFGNLFLAESLVTYLLVYIFGIAWNKFHNKPITKLDLIFVTLFAWLIVFLREPFIPLTGFLVLYIYAEKSFIKLKGVLSAIFVVASILILSTVKWEDYFFNMFTLNFSGYIQDEISNHGIGGIGLLKIFFYPIYIFISGQNNEFRLILLLLSSAFLISLGILIIKKKYILALLIVICLGLANIRFREPGSIFYSGFHMLPWYALYIFIILLIAQQIITLKNFIWYKYFMGLFMIGTVVVSILPPSSTIYRGVNIQEEFNTNYGGFYVNGEVIKILSDADDHLFVDDWDTLIYWQSGLDSSYDYAMFFPVMTSVERFSKKREEMFKNNPPEFYYTDCNDVTSDSYIPEYRLNDYTPLYFNNEKTCLYVLNDKLKDISQSKWEQVQALGFYMLESNY